MKRFCAALLCLLVLTALPASASSPEVQLSVAISRTTLDSYRAMLSQSNLDPLEIKSFDNGPRRAEVELVLAVQAIALGGLEPTVSFQTTPNVGRETHEVAAGRALIASQAYNRATFETPQYVDSVYRSSPFIRLGEFQKGFYAPAGHPIHKARTVAELNAYTGAIGLHWNQDAETLVALGITNFIRTPLFESIPEMIKSGRADYVPLAFTNNENMQIVFGDQTFVPVPGLKFALLETRHLMVSRNHPDGERVFEALERGLATMRQRGTITRAYRECGFIQPKTDSWTLLNRARLDALTAE